MVCCQTCKKENPDEAVFCMYCGERLTHTITEDDSGAWDPSAGGP